MGMSLINIFGNCSECVYDCDSHKVVLLVQQFTQLYIT